MRFASLGSGSRGNAALVQSGNTTLLVDCGFPLNELTARMAQVNMHPSQIDALLITHAHADHIGGSAALTNAYATPIWSSNGTATKQEWKNAPQFNKVNANNGLSYRIGDFDIKPFTVPHDCREPCHYRFESKGRTFAILTDLGSVTPHVKKSLDGLDALSLEFNYDPQMLKDGPYPAQLQKRVSGTHGHLSNRQATELVSSLGYTKWSHLFAAHISEKNNKPDCVRYELRKADQALDEKTILLKQDQVSPWYTI